MSGMYFILAILFHLSLFKIVKLFRICVEGRHFNSKLIKVFFTGLYNIHNLKEKKKQLFWVNTNITKFTNIQILKVVLLLQLDDLNT